MTDVVSQLEAVLAEIAVRTPHLVGCAIERRYPCSCIRDTLLLRKIARTVERLGECIYQAAPGDRYSKVQDHDGVWAAAFRATQEQETPK